MNNKRQMIPAVGLLATFVAAVYMVVQLRAQTTSPTGDFTKATLAEVRDAQGQVILSGQFQLAEEDDDDVERKAALGPTGVDADATGEAEIEFSKAAPAEQEVEFSVRNVPAGTALTFVIDGTDVATATAAGVAVPRSNSSSECPGLCLHADATPRALERGSRLGYASRTSLSLPTKYAAIAAVT